MRFRLRCFQFRVEVSGTASMVLLDLYLCMTSWSVSQATFFLMETSQKMRKGTTEAPRQTSSPREKLTQLNKFPKDSPNNFSLIVP